MEKTPAKMEKPEHGFPVGVPEHLPAVGETGVHNMMCPDFKSPCLRSGCAAWVELYTTDPRNPKNKIKVAHCGKYYWNTIQLTDIKSQLIVLNERVAKALKGT